MHTSSQPIIFISTFFYWVLRVSALVRCVVFFVDARFQFLRHPHECESFRNHGNEQFLLEPVGSLPCNRTVWEEDMKILGTLLCDVRTSNWRGV